MTPTERDEIITRPGKFEGERRVVEAAYEQSMDGLCGLDTYDLGGENYVTITICEVKITDSRGAMSWETVKFYEDDQGFVREVR